MLVARIGLAVAFQALFAVVFVIAGDAAPWRSAADWWLASLAAGEFVNLWLLSRCARLERLRLRDLYNLTRNERDRDLRWTGLALAGAIPLALVPATLLASLIWSDPEVGQTMLFRPIWTPMAWGLLLVFPVIHAPTELPTYYGYVLPRLQVLTKRAWLPLLLTALVLSVQHSFLPLLFDIQYLVWRALMFLPLAIWPGLDAPASSDISPIHGSRSRSPRSVVADLRADRIDQHVASMMFRALDTVRWVRPSLSGGR